jgi:hypothetical protein
VTRDDDQVGFGLIREALDRFRHRSIQQGRGRTPRERARRATGHLFEILFCLNLVHSVILIEVDALEFVLRVGEHMVWHVGHVHMNQVESRPGFTGESNRRRE